MPDEQPQDSPAAPPPAPEHAVPGHSHAHPHLPTFRFIEELKRRNVGRVAVLYIIVSYLVLEVFGVFVHLLELPAWIGRSVVLLVVLGFPVALLIAWIYEITPEGLRPTEEVAPHQSIRHQTGKRLDRAIIAVLALALTYFVLDKFWLSKRNTPVAAPLAATAKETPAIATVSDKSVAVLPFVDMSEKHDQEYFSDGLSEELIDHLAHAADLKVIARTSSFQFKGKNDDMRTIGLKLGVANLLEGSVRTSGKTIRVTAQLINVVDGTHRWSETYDRQMGDVFRLQDDIASAVVAALKATMAARLSMQQVHTSNIDSYNEVLRGRYFNNRVTREDSLRAISAFNQAIKLDPSNSEAWAGLARAYNIRGLNGWMPPRQAYADARNAVNRALSSNPNLAAAHSILGALEWNYNHDFEASHREYRRSVELDPSLAVSSLSEGIDAFAAGQPDRAASIFRRAREVNPLDAFTLNWLSLALYAADSFQEADRVDRELLDISPGFAGIYCVRGEILLAQGQTEAALAMMNRETDEGSRLTCVPDALWTLGRHTEADEMLAEAQRKVPNSQAYAIAFCYAFRNDKDSAFKWLDRSYDNREPEITLIRGFRELRPLRSDPRFKALLEKLKLPK
jgi:adenylate cyclase